MNEGSIATADPRYIRAENRPLFIIYRAHKLADIRKTTAIWREECRRLGIGEVFLCRIDTAADQLPPNEVGLGAVVELQPDASTLAATLGSRFRVARIILDYAGILYASCQHDCA